MRTWWPVGEFSDPEGDRFCSNKDALKFILPAALGAGALFAGPELLGALGPAEAAGGGAAATLGGSDALASAALAAPVDAATGGAGLLAGAPEALSSAALPAASPFLASSVPTFGGAGTSISGVAPEFAPGAGITTGGLPGPPAGSTVNTLFTSSDAGGLSPSQNAPPSLVTTPPPGPTPPPPTPSATGGALAPAPAPPAGASSDVSSVISGGGGPAASVGTGLIPGTDTPLNTGTQTTTLGAGGAGTGSLNDILSGAGGFAKEALPFLGPAASLGGLALSFARNNQPIPYTPQITGAASNINNTAGQISNISPNILSAAQGQVSQGQNLESFLNAGTLPPGVQNGINTATEQAKASIKSRYASSGEAGSSAEAADLANVDSLAAGQGAQLALQLYNQGVSEVTQGVAGEGAAANVLGSSANTTGLSAQLYQYLMEQSLARDQQLGSAIGNFASSLVPRTNINMAPAAA
jgi:hypothetical protein